MRYEYKIVELQGSSRDLPFHAFADDPDQRDSDELNRLGAERWHAFAAVATEAGRIKVFLKRVVFGATDNTVVNVVNTVMPRGSRGTGAHDSD